MKRAIWVGLFVSVVFAATGCGSGVPVNGTVVKDGQPYKLQQGENINITLQGDGASGTATVNEDGSFSATRTDGQPLPAGQYKITIVHYPPQSAAGAKGPPQPKTMSAGETWDVSSSNKTFTLDLAKYKVVEAPK